MLRLTDAPRILRGLLLIPALVAVLACGDDLGGGSSGASTGEEASGGSTGATTTGATTTTATGGASTSAASTSTAGTGGPSGTSDASASTTGDPSGTGDTSGTSGTSGTSDASDASGTTVGDGLSFAAAVFPIIKARCSCHKATYVDAAATYASMVGKPSMGVPDLTLVIPYDIEGSYLLHKLKNTQLEVGGLGSRMPPDKGLSADELATFDAWVDEGAAP